MTHSPCLTDCPTHITWPTHTLPYWLPYTYHMTITWPTHPASLTALHISHDYHMTHSPCLTDCPTHITWPTHTLPYWLPYTYHMTITWPTHPASLTALHISHDPLTLPHWLPYTYHMTHSPCLTDYPTHITWPTHPASLTTLHISHDPLTLPHWLPYTYHMTHSPCLTDCPICILQVTTAQAVEHHGPERLTPDLATILQGGVPAHLSDVQIAANKLVMYQGDRPA